MNIFVAGVRTAEVDKRLTGATEDYLRLRHSAKEAHAASAEEQRRVNESREKVMLGETKMATVVEVSREYEGRFFANAKRT